MLKSKNKFPLLQIALDFTETERAMKVAIEAVKEGVEWVEAGTPLIKSEGIGVVRALKKEFPNKTVIADMKIMDTGRFEAEMAFKSGADVVVVMGAASDSTIREAVEASVNYGGKVMVDLMENFASAERAIEVEKLGVHYIGVHIPIDNQMKGKTDFSLIRQISESVDIPVAAAGGINSENIVEAVNSGASILIVGGAITKSVNVEESVKNIYKALKDKVSIKTDLYKRASLDGIDALFKKISTSNLTDAMHRQGWVRGVVPILKDNCKISGKAVTVRTYPGDWAKPVEAIDIADENSVIIIDAGGVAPAVWGELATCSAITKKVAGVVIYGGVRDVEAIRRLNYPIFATLICPEASEPKGFGEINVPIRIGNQTIYPNDWILGDSDGVAVVSQDRVVETVNRAMDVLERENRIRKEIQDGGTLSSVANLLKWEKIK
ncbi:orotidine 5'-phosphate decarboxylase [bacterium]|nr:orotidine 5'-phosphate decarboxylase [bacterium]